MRGGGGALLKVYNECGWDSLHDRRNIYIEEKAKVVMFLFVGKNVFNSLPR